MTPGHAAGIEMESCFRDIAFLRHPAENSDFRRSPVGDFDSGRLCVSDEAMRDAAAPEQSDRVIRLRKAELIEGLVAEGQLDAAGEAGFRQLARKLGAVFHYQYFAELDRLREVYFHFDPEIDPQARGPAPDLEAAYRSSLRRTRPHPDRGQFRRDRA